MLSFKIDSENKIVVDAAIVLATVTMILGFFIGFILGRYQPL